MKINNPNNGFKKKKVINSKETNKTSKSKSKSKAKSKQKKFNPLQYLNALIQLTESNSCTNRKRKPSTKRDLSSALTLATPALQKTISTSKVRSKSSYSQYRKKTISGLKQVLQIKLDNTVTQQDNIQFTQMTENSNLCNMTESIEIQINSKKQKKTLHAIDYDYYARKIQRAWKNYQTFNVVNKYYEYFRKMAKQQKKQQKSRKQEQLQRQHLQNFQKTEQNEKTIQRIIVSNSQSKCSEYILEDILYLDDQKSKQLDKTLKIKKQKHINVLSDHLAEQELNSTAKKVQIIKCTSQSSASNEPTKSNKQLKQKQFDQKQKNNQNFQRKKHNRIHKKDAYYQDQQQLSKLKHKQTQKLNQVLKIIKKNKKTSEQLLQQLMQKFELNKRALEQQTEERLSPIVLMDSQQLKSKKRAIYEDGISDSSSSIEYSEQYCKNQLKNEKILNMNENDNFLSFNSNEAISSQFSSPNISKEQDLREYQQNQISNQFMKNEESQNKHTGISLLKHQKTQQLHIVTPSSKLLRSGGSFQKYEGLDQINLLQQMSNSSKSDIYNSVFDPISNTDKLFDSRLKILLKKSQNQIKQVEKLASDKKIQQLKALQKKQQIQGRYQRQKRKIQKSKIKYYSALKQVKNQAIRFQKDVIKFNQAQQFKLPIRKCFSAESIILKCIINEPHVLNFDIQDFQDEANQEKLLQSQQNSNIIINGCQSQTSYFDKDFQHIQKCSQQIQKIIQKQLINQIIQQIYTNQSLYKYFKPFVEQVFEFTKVTDFSILTFVRNIPNYIQDKNILSQRMNQKINPSSLQILRLIRDYQFQIEEYQLILPQQTFKSMRKDIESDYAQQLKQKCKCIEIPRQIENIDVIDKILKKQK